MALESVRKENDSPRAEAEGEVSQSEMVNPRTNDHDGFSKALGKVAGRHRQHRRPLAIDLHQLPCERHPRIPPARIQPPCSNTRWLSRLHRGIRYQQ